MMRSHLSSTRIGKSHSRSSKTHKYQQVVGKTTRPFNNHSGSLVKELCVGWILILMRMNNSVTQATLQLLLIIHRQKFMLGKSKAWLLDKIMKKNLLYRPCWSWIIHLITKTMGTCHRISQVVIKLEKREAFHNLDQLITKSKETPNLLVRKCLIENPIIKYFHLR